MAALSDKVAFLADVMRSMPEGTSSVDVLGRALNRLDEMDAQERRAIGRVRRSDVYRARARLRQWKAAEARAVTVTANGCGEDERLAAIRLLAACDHDPERAKTALLWAIVVTPREESPC